MDGLNVRSAAGALVDLAGRVFSTAGPEGHRNRPCGRRLGERDLVRAWKEADYLNLLRHDKLEAELGKGINGTRLIRQIMAAHPIVSDDTTDLATRAEFKLLTAVLRLGLPRPLTNQPLRLPGATYFPDQFYPGAGVVVEADGGVHTRPARRAADRARDDHMRANGLEVLRFANKLIDANAEACALTVADVVSRRPVGDRLAYPRRRLRRVPPVFPPRWPETRGHSYGVTAAP